MKKASLAIITSLVLLGIIVGSIYWLSMNKILATKPTSKVNPTPVAVQEPVVAPAVTETKSLYYYPMAGFDSRIKYRWFGKYVNSSDVVPDCGAVFNGYHNGDDLEVTLAEKTVDVPVYAVTNGTVKLAQNISGYGGLLVLSGTINGEAVTMNYGHVRLSSISHKVGDSVKAGQQVALLGTGCSAQTAGERKHLHFAIHKGTAVDVRGYLPNQASLANWIDPKVLLDGLKPNSPK